jgi:hypothetical protein
VTRGAALLTVLLVAGCYAAPPAATVPPVPAELRSCPPGRTMPPPPPAPRTFTSLILWIAKSDIAAHANERARTECADRLARLNRWIGTMRN